jgi:ABC-type cobalamin/Fe3+-siderophores transport system ATPase subunit
MRDEVGSKKNIAIEILSNLSVDSSLTNGLDTFTAFKLLKRLAKGKGMTIVWTIHQPRVTISELSVFMDPQFLC